MFRHAKVSSLRAIREREKEKERERDREREKERKRNGHPKQYRPNGEKHKKAAPPKKRKGNTTTALSPLLLWPGASPTTCQRKSVLLHRILGYSSSNPFSLHTVVASLRLCLAHFAPRQLSPVSPAFLALSELSSLLSVAPPALSSALAPPALSSVPRAPPALSPIPRRLLISPRFLFTL